VSTELPPDASRHEEPFGAVALIAGFDDVQAVSEAAVMVGRCVSASL
jgi:hypothetical protein